jgi:hypothetical protein
MDLAETLTDDVAATAAGDAPAPATSSEEGRPLRLMSLARPQRILAVPR